MQESAQRNVNAAAVSPSYRRLQQLMGTPPPNPGPGSRRVAAHHPYPASNDELPTPRDALATHRDALGPARGPFGACAPPSTAPISWRLPVLFIRITVLYLQQPERPNGDQGRRGLNQARPRYGHLISPLSLLDTRNPNPNPQASVGLRRLRPHYANIHQSYRQISSADRRSSPLQVNPAVAEFTAEILLLLLDVGSWTVLGLCTCAIAVFRLTPTMPVLGRGPESQDPLVRARLITGD